MLPDEIHLVLVVYGKRYVDLFKGICVPNLVAQFKDNVSSNNIPKIIGNIYTAETDIDEIEEALIPFKETIPAIPWTIIPFINQADSPSIYQDMNTAHRLALRHAWSRNAGMLFLFPDVIFSRGSIRSVLNILSQGYRGIIAPSLRTTSETIYPLLLEKIKSHSSGMLDMASREAVSCALDHLHEIVKDLFWDHLSQPISTKIYSVYQPVDGRGLICKTLLGYPVYIWPEKEIFDYKGTYEMEMLHAAFHSYKSIYMVNDSDELFAFEISPKSKKAYSKYKQNRSIKIFSAINDADSHTEYHLRGALVNAFLHTDDLDAKWHNESELFASKINPILLQGLFLRWCKSQWKKILEYFFYIATLPVAGITSGIYFFAGKCLVKQLRPGCRENSDNSLKRL